MNNKTQPDRKNLSESASTMISDPEAEISPRGTSSSSYGKDDHGAIDDVLSQMNNWVKSAADYMASRPGESLFLAAAAGIGLYALLGTKPGRKVFDAGALVLVPQISRWLSENLGKVSSNLEQVTRH